MLFEACKEILYSDTLVPDIFITEYLPSMSSDCIKVYIYCLFLSKNLKQASTDELSKMLGMDIERVKDSFKYLESSGIFSRKSNGIVFTDLKEKEIKKIYRLKLTSTPEEAALSTDRNKKRNETVSAINNTFFQGVMAPSWYTDIDAWFDRYKFDEYVMYSLFNHCRTHNGLNKNYIIKVADNWHSKNIRTHIELDNYWLEYEKYKDAKGNIIKKLKLGRNLTEYEDVYVEKWVLEYNYPFDIIELALKKTTARTNPNFKYLDAIISDWYKNGLRNKEDIAAHENARKAKAKTEAKTAVRPGYTDYEQRQYDDSYYDNFFTNVKKHNA